MKVLVVDDKKNDRRLLCKLLTSNDYEVAEASNGIEALESIRASKPKLIISDIMMPGMDGFTLLRELKKDMNTKDIPLVFYTAYYLSEKDSELAAKLGASRYIIKPAEPADLIEEIAVVISEYEAGLLKPTASLIRTEEEYLKQYSERIVSKLEEKIDELEGEIEKRKHAEEKLREASVYTRSLIEVSLDPLVTISSDGKITDVNKATELVAGVSREQLIGSDFSDYFTEPEKAREGYRQGFEKGFVKDYPLVIRHTSGKITDVLYNAAVYKDAAGNVAGVFAAARDITECKRAEEQILQQKDFLNNIFESLTHPFYVINASDYTIMMANPAASMGRLAEGSKCYALTHGRKKPCSYENTCPLDEVKTTKKQVTVEQIHHDKDGNARYVEVHGYPIFDKEGNVVQMIEYCLDITEKKKAEKEIHLLASIVKNIPESVCTIDLDRNIVSWNEGAEKMLGYKKEEIMGKPITITIPEKLARREIDHCLGILNTEGFFTGYESVRIAKDGRILPVEITAVALKDEKLNIIGYTSIIRDITERKKTEEVHLENIRLEAADKAKSEFLANMSHELRTPLNAILGFSELMKQGISGKLNEKQERFIDNIHSSGTFLLSLINDILDLSKVEAGKMELVIDKMSVPVTIKETLALIKEKALKHNVNIETELDPAVEFIDADKQRFKQILFNLLGNAVKFSKPEGETVTITAKKEGDMAKFSVSDTGTGIKEDNMAKLFHKFEQLEPEMARKYGGTGLGLAISKQLVELHGGKMWAESKYGEGSTFTFILPIKGKKTVENT